MSLEDLPSAGSGGRTAGAPAVRQSEPAESLEPKVTGRSDPQDSVAIRSSEHEYPHSAPATDVAREQPGKEPSAPAYPQPHESFLPQAQVAQRPAAEANASARPESEASHSQPVHREQPHQAAQYPDSDRPASTLGLERASYEPDSQPELRGFSHHATASAFRQQPQDTEGNTVPQSLPEAVRAAQLAPQYGLPVSVPTPLHAVHIQAPGPKCYNRKNGAKSNPWEVVLSFRGLNIKLWNLVTGAKTFKYEEAGPHGFLGELAQSTATEQGSLEALNSWIKHRASTGENLPLPNDMLHAARFVS
ncbi:hypothetical protein WJX74_006817 [Apatococcus lobatus]|uniref:Uncharacterized protein n=1 Tax=Apatococcus lobatus TaxID=904363 RepID=A0AAW1QX69_9CHLO